MTRLYKRYIFKVTVCTRNNADCIM